MSDILMKMWSAEKCKTEKLRVFHCVKYIRWINEWKVNIKLLFNFDDNYSKKSIYNKLINNKIKLLKIERKWHGLIKLLLTL